MLSKETKVSVKNKENKTACFIEIEELLNSLELISDLPRLGIEDQEMGWRARRGEWGEKPQGSRKELLQSGLAAETWPSERSWVQVFCPQGRSGCGGEFDTLVSECMH